MVLSKYGKGIKMSETKIEIKIPENIMEDMLVTALEGGSNYWAEQVKFINKKPQRKKPYLPSYITTPLSKDGILQIKDTETGYLYDLSRQAILKGIKVMAEKEAQHFGDMMKEDGDAITGDVFLQCALFGKVKYG